MIGLCWSPVGCFLNGCNRATTGDASKAGRLTVRASIP
jgi:hypothetical protein